MSKPPNATILISEEGSPSYTVLYRSLASGCHDNIEALENAMPLWLAEYLLLNQSPVMPPPIKVSFVLVPWNKDQDAEPLPELLNTYAFHLCCTALGFVFNSSSLADNSQNLRPIEICAFAKYYVMWEPIFVATRISKLTTVFLL